MKFINTWKFEKQSISNKYVNLYILPIVCTFGFTGNHNFKNHEPPLSTSEQRCFITKDIYLSINEENNLNQV